MKKYLPRFSMLTLGNPNYLNILFLSALSIGGLQRCSSSGEDDATLEATEPVDAAPAEVKDETSADESKAPAEPAASAEAPSAAEPVAPPAAAPSAGEAAAGAGTMMNTSRRVMYVKVGTAVLREQPDAKAQVVGKAGLGDHFLVTVEGEWARTDDGKFISMKVLSEKGVGRGKKAADWGQSQAVPEKPSKKRAKKAARAAQKPTVDAEPKAESNPAPVPEQ